MSQLGYAGLCLLSFLLWFPVYKKDDNARRLRGTDAQRCEKHTEQRGKPAQARSQATNRTLFGEQAQTHNGAGMLIACGKNTASSEHASSLSDLSRTSF